MLIPPLKILLRNAQPTGGLRLGRNDTYIGTTLEARLELDVAASRRKQGVVFGQANIVAGMELGATLTNENVTCNNRLAAEFLDPEAAVMSVMRRTVRFWR